MHYSGCVGAPTGLLRQILPGRLGGDRAAGVQSHGELLCKKRHRRYPCHSSEIDA